jgi:hypothetical protein
VRLDPSNNHPARGLRLVLTLAALSVLSACSSVMLEPGDHGQALHKALQAQRMAPVSAPAPSSRAAPALATPPAAVELKGAMDNYLQGRMPAAGGGLTPALGETLR